MEGNSHADGYRFGIELEYRLSLRDNPQTYFDRPKIKDQLAKLWNNAWNGFDDHIPMKVGYSMGKDEAFQAWSIVDEHSMEGGQFFPTCSFEFVSPIFYYRDGSRWANQIKRLSDYISRYTQPEMDETTGIHIHVSPVNGRWSLVDLKRIAQAIIHFDDPLKTLFPDHKYTQAHLKSNLRHNRILNELPAGKSPSIVIQDAKTIDELIYIVNPPDERTEFSQRKYSWNFTNNSDNPSVCPKPKYTIEFRSPRSTTACNLIEKWIAFTVTFLHGSVTSPENIHNDFEQTVDGLNGFLFHNRPPGGTNDYCWEKHLSQNAVDKVLNDVGHHTVEQ